MGKRSKMMEDNIQDVKQRLLASPRKSLRRLSQETRRSYSTCRRAAKQEKTKPYHITAVHELRPPDLAKRLSHLFTVFTFTENNVFRLLVHYLLRRESRDLVLTIPAPVDPSLQSSTPLIHRDTANIKLTREAMVRLSPRGLCHAQEKRRWMAVAICVVRLQLWLQRHYYQNSLATTACLKRFSSVVDMSDSKVWFTAMEDEKLVEIVAKHPSLYDLENPLYKDQVIKDNAWKEVADHLRRSAKDCKKRWRNIKDTYNRRIKKGKGTGSSTSSKPEKWALAEMLSFLDKVKHKRLSISNIGINSVNSDSVEEGDFEGIDVGIEESGGVIQNISDQSASSFAAIINDESSTANWNLPRSSDFSHLPTKRQKLNEKIAKLIEERSCERSEILKLISQRREDSVDLFFRSVAMSVKQLRPELINETKMRTLQLVFEMESRNASPTSHNLSPACSSSPEQV
uniref:(California timema) hypothetical protein n=1 Tax=Timema californicum TaxID=61474 RepID=A0A7R9PBM8_TIMCA|nr:unnamed protein product [Timema californicum]